MASGKKPHPFGTSGNFIEHVLSNSTEEKHMPSGRGALINIQCGQHWNMLCRGQQREIESTTGAQDTG